MESGKYDIERIRKYLVGELSPRDMFVLERQAEDDPALTDLIEGMEAAGSAPIHQANIDAVKDRIKALHTAPERGKILSFPWQNRAIAASLAFVAGLGALLLWFPSPDPQVEFAQQVTPVPRESVITPDPAPEQESAADEPASVSSARSAAPPASQLASPRVAVRPGAGEVDESRQPSTAQPSVLSALRQADSQGTADEIQAVTPVAARETVLLAGRREAADANGKRLAMAIRSLPTDTVARPLYRTVSGVVREKETGDPLGGASVYGAHGAIQTATDGTFTVTIPTHRDSLKVATAGFRAQALDVRNGDSVVVVLERDAAELSESVAGNRRAAKRYAERAAGATATQYPKPISGWTNFAQYLQRETASSSGKGTVTLKFTVGDKGQPMDVQLEHTTNPALVKRATEILQAGPRWERGPKGDRTAIVVIEFR